MAEKEYTTDKMGLKLVTKREKPKRVYAPKPKPEPKQKEAEEK